MSAEVAVLHHAPDRAGVSPLRDASAECPWCVDVPGHASRRAEMETGAIGAGRIVQLDPDGPEIRAIELPLSRPTKPASCGPDLSTLAVTTMSEGTEGEALAGAVLLLDPGTRGWPLPRARI